LLAEEMGVAHGQLHGFGQEQPLGRRGAGLFEPPHHLFKENALVAAC